MLIWRNEWRGPEFISSDDGGLLRHLMDIGGGDLLEEFFDNFIEEFDDD